MKKFISLLPAAVLMVSMTAKNASAVWPSEISFEEGANKTPPQLEKTSTAPVFTTSLLERLEKDERQLAETIALLKKDEQKIKELLAIKEKQNGPRVH